MGQADEIKNNTHQNDITGLFRNGQVDWAGDHGDTVPVGVVARSVQATH